MACQQVTCEEVFPRYCVTPEQLSVPCSFENCNELSHILLNWETLGPVIGLSEIDIGTIQFNHPRDYRSQCCSALTMWRQRLGSRATFLCLARGLERVGDIDAVEKLCSVFHKLRLATMKIEAAMNSTTAALQALDFPSSAAELSCNADSSMAVQTELECLDERLSHFENEFRYLVYDTSKELTGRNKVPLRRLKFDLTLLPLEIKADHVTYIKENLTNLKNAEDITDIFMLLNTYWDHFNYTLLERIIDLHGSYELQQRMKIYISDLHHFWQQTKVSDFINCCQKNNYKLRKWSTVQTPSNFAEIKCVVNKPVSECTLYEIESVRCQFSQGFRLQDFALILFEIRESSLIISWIIDVSLKRVMRDVPGTKKSQFLEDLKVMFIYMDGDCIYNGQEWKYLVGPGKLKDVTITYSHTLLGRGCFASVFKGMFGDTTCAAKVFHSTFCYGAASKVRFYQEFKYLEDIRHPNLVQCLGLYEDPVSHQSVLLMELMDGNLTNFLENTPASLSLAVQLRLCHDVAKALSYLHSVDIIHRDLTSNNVLLGGSGGWAKVSDFGLSTIMTAFGDRSEYQLTMSGPSSLAYLAPEALIANPKYTFKLDSFSFGVLVIQIITRLFPSPLPRMKVVESPLSPGVTTWVPIAEIECRKEHIDMVDKSNPLLKIAIECLAPQSEDRPPARALCEEIQRLRQLRSFCEDEIDGCTFLRKPHPTTPV